MAKPIRALVRGGVILLVVGGAVALVAESARPGSVAAVSGRVQQVVGDAIDRGIGDPAALRAQIAELESQYPEKIAAVRRDLAEVEQQIVQMEREAEVSGRVVELTTADLDALDAGIEQARVAGLEREGVLVKVAFSHRRMDVATALGKRGQIERTRATHATRAEEIGAEVTLLEEQRGQLAELLARLETERAEFQSQLVQLDAQIDAIERGERMLATMEARQATIDEHSRYRAHSLEQLTTRLEKARAEQRGRFEALARREASVDYEDAARYELSREGERPRIPETASDGGWASAEAGGAYGASLGDPAARDRGELN